MASRAARDVREMRIAAMGMGEIVRPRHSLFLDHRDPADDAAIRRRVPYSPVVVELEEGVRMVSWLIDVAPAALRLDLPVQVVFDDVTAEVTLPKFRKA